MPYDSVHNRRRSIRLPDYDYTQPGAYFVTLVTHRREHLFGEIRAGEMQFTVAGQAAAAVLQALPNHFSITLDCWVIMPNHVHLILVLHDLQKTGKEHNRAASPTLPVDGTIPDSLGAIVQNYKSVSAIHINRLRHLSGHPVWQRGYYERVICNSSEWDTFAKYIEVNPQNWELDEEFG